MPRKALGKGLEVLFSAYQEKVNEEIHEVPISEIFPNRFQPRQIFDDQKIDDLALSIKTYGLIHPIFLKRHVHGFEIVAGERRWRAAKRAGLDKIPAIIRDVSEDKKLEISLIENIQRENLNPIEEGKSYKLLLDHFDYTQQKLSEKIGKDRSTISNMIRLLSLSDKLKTFIAEGKLSMGHARAILAVEKEEDRLLICDSIIKKGLSVRETETLVKKFNNKPDKNKQDPIEKYNNVQNIDLHTSDIEKALSIIFGTNVSLIEKKGKGKIVIKFNSIDEKNRIINFINSNYYHLSL